MLIKYKHGKGSAEKQQEAAEREREFLSRITPPIIKVITRRHSEVLSEVFTMSISNSEAAAGEGGGGAGGRGREPTPRTLALGFAPSPGLVAASSEEEEEEEEGRAPSHPATIQQQSSSASSEEDAGVAREVSSSELQQYQPLEPVQEVEPEEREEGEEGEERVSSTAAPPAHVPPPSPLIATTNPLSPPPASPRPKPKPERHPKEIIIYIRDESKDKEKDMRGMQGMQPPYDISPRQMYGPTSGGRSGEEHGTFYQPPPLPSTSVLRAGHIEDELTEPLLPPLPLPLPPPPAPPSRATPPSSPSWWYTWVSILTLSNLILGIGVIAIPRTFALSGVVLGSIILGAAAGGAVVSASLMCHRHRHHNGGRGHGYRYSSYEEVVRKGLGAGGHAVWNAAVAAVSFGLVVVYLVALGDILTKSNDDDKRGGLFGEVDKGVAVGALCVVIIAPLVAFHALQCTTHNTYTDPDKNIYIRQQRGSAITSSSRGNTTNPHCPTSPFSSSRSLLGVSVIFMFTLVVLLILITSISQHTAHRVQLWPMMMSKQHWLRDGIGMLATTVPVVLVVLGGCQTAVHSVEVERYAAIGQGVTYREEEEEEEAGGGGGECDSYVSLRRVSTAATALSVGVLTLVSVSSLILFGGHNDKKGQSSTTLFITTTTSNTITTVHDDVLLNFSNYFLEDILGNVIGKAVFLGIRLAFVVSLIISLPSQMLAFTHSFWNLIFLTSLKAGPGMLIVNWTTLLLAFMVSLRVEGSVGGVVWWVGGTAGLVTALLLPGLVGMKSDRVREGLVGGGFSVGGGHVLFWSGVMVVGVEVLGWWLS